MSPSLFGGAEEPVPIDYAGPPGTFRSISYSRLLSGRFPPRLFAGKIAIVGASAPTLQDLHQTPVSGGEPMAGPEVPANETNTVLAGIPLREPAQWVALLLDRAARPVRAARRGAAGHTRGRRGGRRLPGSVVACGADRLRLGHAARLLQRPGPDADPRHGRGRRSSACGPSAATTGGCESSSPPT